MVHVTLGSGLMVRHKQEGFIPALCHAVTALSSVRSCVPPHCAGKEGLVSKANFSHAKSQRCEQNK